MKVSDKVCGFAVEEERPWVKAAMDDSLFMARLHVLSIFSCKGRHLPEDSSFDLLRNNSLSRL